MQKKFINLFKQGILCQLHAENKMAEEELLFLLKLLDRELSAL